MRIAILFLTFFGLLYLYSCTSQKESDLKPDCSGSTLSISDISITNAGCSEPGSLMVTASGGEGQLMYSLGGNVFQAPSVFEGLSAGNYNVVVKDDNECTVSTAVTVGAESGSVTLALDSKTTSGCGDSNGSLAVSASGGIGTYTFKIDEGSFGQSGSFSGLDQGQHIVQAKDEEGCTTSLTVTILSGVSLGDQIMPIIENNCAVSSCHLDTEFPRFTSQNAVRNEAARIKSQTSSGSMPPPDEPDLTDEEIELIACWADDVAANN